MANQINETHEQVIYDTLFMSEPEFGLVYGELYPSYSLKDLKEMFHRIRNRIIDEKIGYNRKLRKTRLGARSFGDVRMSQGSNRTSEPRPSKTKKEEEQPIRKEKRGSLKDDIIKLHEEGKTKSQIRDELGCKYQYVFQTVKKYELSKESEATG